MNLLFRNACILVFANKQDVSNACNASELREKLDLDSLCTGRDWFFISILLLLLLLFIFNTMDNEIKTRYIQPCCGLTGDGLLCGFEWLSGALKRKNIK
jgi:hypothetical protein